MGALSSPSSPILPPCIDPPHSAPSHGPIASPPVGAVWGPERPHLAPVVLEDHEAGLGVSRHGALQAGTAAGPVPRCPGVQLAEPAHPLHAHGHSSTPARGGYRARAGPGRSTGCGNGCWGAPDGRGQAQLSMLRPGWHQAAGRETSMRQGAPCPRRPGRCEPGPPPGTPASSPPGREEGAEGRAPRPAHLQQGQSARSSRKGGHCRGRSSAGHTQSSLQARGAHTPSIHSLALPPISTPRPFCASEPGSRVHTGTAVGSGEGTPRARGGSPQCSAAGEGGSDPSRPGPGAGLFPAPEPPTSHCPWGTRERAPGRPEARQGRGAQPSQAPPLLGSLTGERGVGRPGART